MKSKKSRAQTLNGLGATELQLNSAKPVVGSEFLAPNEFQSLRNYGTTMAPACRIFSSDSRPPSAVTGRVAA